MAKKTPLLMYSPILSAIFNSHYKPGLTSFQFKRQDIEKHAHKLGIALPKNVGDLIYTFKYRRALPADITATAPAGFEWVIEAAGKSIYRFRIGKIHRIVPAKNQYIIKIPDATPELVAAYAFTDEQALLAKVRYNRLVDIFLRVTAYSLQNHLRTFVPKVGQLETDELYVGIRNTGEQFIIPVQAKGKRDRIGPGQVLQDIAMCAARFPQLVCRPVAMQFAKDEAGNETIAMFELIQADDGIKIIDQKQYRLVPATEITPEDLAAMSTPE